jgi:hypothetical protein
MTDNIASFSGGFVAGILGAFRLFTYPIQIYTGHQPSDMAIDFAVKVLGTVIIGLLGGLTGLFTKDLYKWLKSKFKKDE